MSKEIRYTEIQIHLTFPSMHCELHGKFQTFYFFNCHPQKPESSTIESCLCKSEQLLSRTEQVGHPRVKAGESHVGGLSRPVS